MVMQPSTSANTARTERATVSHAVTFDEPRKLSLRKLTLPACGPNEVVVDVQWSGISTGTERLLWTGDMPPFPGLGYPLVPGYESVGVVRRAGAECRLQEGDTVFVPGAQCYGEIRGLFGGTASRLVVPEARIRAVDERLGRNGALLALAATAYHALKPTPDAALPDLIVGHGVLGRLLARLTMALGGPPPTVWESVADRRDSADGYPVIAPTAEGNFHTVMDASGDAGIVDQLMPVLAKGGEIVLAGFYAAPLSFAFPPAFMKEARLRVAAEWQPDDFDATCALTREQPELLDGLITHCLPVNRAAEGYRTAFTDPHCLKMILDWTGAASH